MMENTINVKSGDVVKISFGKDKPQKIVYIMQCNNIKKRVQFVSHDGYQYDYTLNGFYKMQPEILFNIFEKV